MRNLQDLFHSSLQGAPTQLLAHLIHQKLADQDVRLSERDRERLLEYIMSGAQGTLNLGRWKWWQRKQVTLHFTEEDGVRFDRLAAKFEAEIPNMVEQLSDRTVEIMLADMHKHWPAESRAEQRELRGFRERLARTWGNPFDLLRLLLALAREYGEEVGRELGAATAHPSPHLVEALTRLQARACRLAAEVLALLESGFSEGALARWRSLHEVATVANLLSDGDDALAERYLLHVRIEEWRAAKEYRAYSTRLGLESLTPAEHAALEGTKDALVERFGKSYATQYGWAAEKLKTERPTFADIEAFVGLDHLRPLYRLASHAVHANPKGVFVHLGLFGDEDFLLAGPSNTGLGEPGR
jgi:hypothetical protein